MTDGGAAVAMTMTDGGATTSVRQTAWGLCGMRRDWSLDRPHRSAGGRALTGRGRRR